MDSGFKEASSAPIVLLPTHATPARKILMVDDAYFPIHFNFDHSTGSPPLRVMSDRIVSSSILRVRKRTEPSPKPATIPSLNTPPSLGSGLSGS